METVLVCDDDIAILESIEIILKQRDLMCLKPKAASRRLISLHKMKFNALCWTL